MCTDTFEEFPDYKSTGSVHTMTAGTVTLCEVTCLSRDDCTAYDYGDVSKTCDLYSDAAATQRLRAEPGVTFYRRKSCKTEALPGQDLGNTGDGAGELYD